jgi:dolichol-phosphate mannosyltransferase
MISIIVPLYNEELNVKALYERLNASSKSWKNDCEFILVDDGSVDRTYEYLIDISRKDIRVKIVKFSRNFGHQAAISAGIKESTGNAVVIMDGDLQDPPEELEKFLEKWRQGYEVVYAIRKKRKEGLLKKLAYKVFYRLLSLISEIDIPLDSGDFCVMDRKVVNVLNEQLPEKLRFVRGLRAFSGFKQIGIEYERQARTAGQPKYTFKKLLKLAIDGLLDFSTFPLRLATYVGFFFSSFSFIMALLFIISRFVDVNIMGYEPSKVTGIATIVVGMFFIGGIVLVVLGIIGEYIGRIYLETKKRPQYIIENKVNFN